MAESGVRRVRERFQPNRDWPPLWLLGLVLAGALTVLALIPDLDWWERLLGLPIVAVYAAWMAQNRLRTRGSDYLAIEQAPEGRRVVRPEAWEDVARRAGLRFHGGREPRIAGRYAFVDLSMRFTGSWYEGKVAGRPLRITEVKARARGRTVLRLRPREEEAGDSRLTTGDAAFDEAYRIDVRPPDEVPRMLPAQVRKVLLDLGDARADVDLEVRVWTRGFEADPARIEALLMAAALLARAGREGEAAEG